MSSKLGYWGWRLLEAMSLAVLWATPSTGQNADANGDGYIGHLDLPSFLSCLVGPGESCSGVPVDLDEDGDVDLADFSQLAVRLGHLPIPLRDSLGNMLTLDSTAPYNGRQTCAGSCHAHDINYIANGLHFQQGRTDVSGALATGDDAFGDGRWWNFSRGRYGRWVAGLDLTAKSNTHDSEIAISSYAWIRDCSGCHTGGGPGEFDRDGYPYFDYSTSQFGFQQVGKSWEEARLDGDYNVLNMSTGNVEHAPWDVTGVSSPDCLFCHRADRAMDGLTSMNLAWRQATLKAGATLVSGDGNPVRAFEAAPTAGQGWFSILEIVGGAATKLQIDYATGVTNGSLQAHENGNVSLAPTSFNSTPTDQVCAPCHKQTLNHSGVWFDERDVHFAKLNRRDDADPANDVPDEQSRTCVFCHPGNLEHNFGKGNFMTHNWRDELDWVDFRSCRECHLEDSPIRHPDAPPVPGNLSIHLAMWGAPDVLSCQACHIPYGLVSPYSAVFDSSVVANFSFEPARKFYSADPLNPTDPDKSRWYPALVMKTDSDGRERLFPGGTTPSVYWADWDQNSTPQDFTDDTIAPVRAPQMKLLTGGVALPGVTDDNGDGKLEVNRPQEVLAYIRFLAGDNPRGKVLATRPVLVKGKGVWYKDSSSPDGVSSFDFTSTGIAMESWSPFIYSVDHNVLVKEEAWGYDDPNMEGDGCGDCHRAATLDSPVFDRLILVDPWGPDGQPAYETIREMSGLNPP